MFEIAIKLDENIYTRLFDNGLEPSEADINEIKIAIREGTILKPHGKLIDVDALECEPYLISKGNGMYEEVKGYFNIDDVSTILEATEEG